MNPIDQIADLVVEEALRRTKLEDDIGAKIHEVRMEIMLITIDLISEIRESERQMKRKEKQPCQP